MSLGLGMSLYKQLLVLVSCLFCMIFSVNYAVSVHNTMEYLEVESKIHAQDTATSLGLSLSPHLVAEDVSVVETMMNSIFDRGYYKEINLLGPDGETIVALQNDHPIEGVPSWFVALLAMETAVAESEMSAGWVLAGVVQVTINPGVAYLKLYEQAQHAGMLSLVMLGVSVGILFFILKYILLPLKNMEQLSLAIAKGHFGRIEKLPRTTEFKNVVIAMNLMSSRVKGMMDNLNSKLKRIGEAIQHDELTGLIKKNGFDTALKQLISQDVNGFVMLIKVDDLAGFVEQHGMATTDLLLKDFANVLAEKTQDSAQLSVSAYRFYGGEFALLVKAIADSQTLALAKQLQDDFHTLGQKYNKAAVAHMGITPFNFLDTNDDVLNAAGEAFEEAKLIGVNEFCLRERSEQARNVEQWHSLVAEIISKSRYHVDYIQQVKALKGNNAILEEASIQAQTESGELIPARIFVSIAEKFNLITELDKGVINTVISQYNSNPKKHPVAVNLSLASIQDVDFRNWLKQLLTKNKQLHQQLVFSVSTFSIVKDIKTYESFVSFIHDHNGLVMLKRFETHSMSIEGVKDLKPDYIRLSRDLSNDVHNDSGKQQFIQSMQELGHLLGVVVLAESVSDHRDISYFRKVGFAGVSLSHLNA